METRFRMRGEPRKLNGMRTASVIFYFFSSFSFCLGQVTKEDWFFDGRKGVSSTNGSSSFRLAVFFFVFFLPKTVIMFRKTVKHI